MSSLQIRRYEPRDYERVLELHVLGLRQTGTDLGPGSFARRTRRRSAAKALARSERPRRRYPAPQ